MRIELGDNSKQVRYVQRALRALKFWEGKPLTGDFDRKTENAVLAFQKKFKLYVDGIVGPITANTINKELIRKGRPDILLIIEESTSIMPTNNKKLKWIKVPADVFPGRQGYAEAFLREDAAKSYMKLREEVISLGGIISSGGARRKLASKASPNRSRKSLHYVGRAIDLAVPTGMFKVKTDPYIITKDGKRLWEVWCRTSNPNVPEIELVAISHQGKQQKETIVKGRFFSFTKLAKKHGWERIPARRAYVVNGTYMASEWWHFQWEEGLIPNKTTFGEELLKVYSLSECEQFIYWNDAKNAVWKLNWA